MGILFLADNAGVGCANWVLRNIVEEVAAILRESESEDLAAWLTAEQSPVYLYSTLDVRDLVPPCREAFLSTLLAAHEQCKQRGPDGWREPSAFGGYLGLSPSNRSTSSKSSVR